MVTRGEGRGNPDDCSLLGGSERSRVLGICTESPWHHNSAIQRRPQQRQPECSSPWVRLTGAELRGSEAAHRIRPQFF